jgi:hypothetical protein
MASVRNGLRRDDGKERLSNSVEGGDGWILGSAESLAVPVVQWMT